jgi:shikimate kinase
MSNIGKSHWARRMAAEAGYEWIECDDLIETQLGDILVKLGYRGLNDMARWMGQPYDAQYKDTSRKYMDCERAVMLDIIERLRAPSTRPLVIDTTGSVIYAGDDMLAKLKKLTHVLYFEASIDHVDRLFKQYLANPKPVIWGESYTPTSDETPGDSLERCYPELLNYRAARYRDWAHIMVPYEDHRSAAADWRHFLAKDRGARDE